MNAGRGTVMNTGKGKAHLFLVYFSLWTKFDLTQVCAFQPEVLSYDWKFSKRLTACKYAYLHNII